MEQKSAINIEPNQTLLKQNMKSLNKIDYRKILFIHLKGIVIIPNLNTIFNSIIIDELTTNNKVTINDINDRIQTNSGYLNVSLRQLRSAGLLKFQNNNDEFKNYYEITEDLLELYNLKKEISIFDQLTSYHSQFSHLKEKEIDAYTNIIHECYKKLNEIKQNNNIKEKYYYLFEGMLLGPILNNLSFYNYLDNLNNDNFVLKNLNLNLTKILDCIFALANLIKLENENYKITEKGKYFITRASSYGVTCSYLPTLSKTNDLLFGNCSFIWDKDQDNNEIHVNRTMNVWGSGGAHKTYFKKIDNIIMKIFNLDLQKQPKGIVDVGCGDGTFLIHLYDMISNQTLRGQHLKDFPLKIIGIDINKAARIASRKKLNDANIENIVINGNINEPHKINENLIRQYKINLNDCLNVRTFLDHNRIYTNPKQILYKNILSSGSFCFKGKLISNDELINNMIEHFSNWKPYVSQFGLIILELHTLIPELTMENQSNTPSIAYDTTHGFSDQYLIEHDVFIECLKKAKLVVDIKYQNLFPNNHTPTVSINYIK